MQPPRIETAELLLRPWRPADAADAARAGRERAGTDVAAGVLDGGRLVGAVGLSHLDRRARTAELTCWSAPWARGRRVAERAARALLRWAFDELGLVRVDGRALVGDHAARLVGLRLGFTLIGRRPGGTEEWLAALVPGDLTGPGHELPAAVRCQARVFGGPMPELRDGPVRLRPLAAADRAAITAAYRDPEVVRWYGVPVPYLDEHATHLIHRSAPLDWARGVEAVFAVTGPDGRWAGTADLRVDERDPATGEVGFVVAPAARGRGLATGAVRALTRWGFGELGLARIQWRAEVGNVASRRVAEKAGFAMEGLLRRAVEENGRRHDCWIASMVGEDSD